MGKQTKSKKQEFVGKGKITPVQIAFIVDRYLCDNSYTKTRSTFRSEASHFIAKSPVQEAPKSLLSLAAILDEYITLKEQKVSVDQERCRLEQEKLRVQNLLSGMQDVMNAYNAVGNVGVTPPPPAVAYGAIATRSEVAVGRPAGYYPMYDAPAMMSSSGPSTTQKDQKNFSTPTTYQAIGKRKESKDVSDGHVASKRSRRCTLPKHANLVTPSSNAEQNQEKSVIASVPQSSGCDIVPNGSPVQGSNVVKCLFNQESPRANSTIPKTPPRASSSQTEKTTSPLETYSTATSNKDATPQQIMSANCTIISSETIRVSPNKQIAYYSIEKNHISTCSPLKTNLKRSNIKDHVRGRLDFGASEMPMITENQTPDGNSTSESEKEGDILDLDFPNLDALGFDFNLSEFLLDIDLGSEDMALSSQQVVDSSPDYHSRSPPQTGNVGMSASQITSEFSSTMTGFIGEGDMGLVAGTDSVAAMRSVTKCITIVSPAKRRSSNLDQNKQHRLT